jgi:hypothetical protein
MGTRQFCDLCGNTVTGALAAYLITETESDFELLKKHYHPALQQVQAISGALAGRQAATGPSKTLKSLKVELCPHCAEVWWDRVSRLTKDSDPK